MALAYLVISKNLKCLLTQRKNLLYAKEQKKYHFSTQMDESSKVVKAPKQQRVAYTFQWTPTGKAGQGMGEGEIILRKMSEKKIT